MAEKSKTETGETKETNEKISSSLSKIPTHKWAVATYVLGLIVIVLLIISINGGGFSGNAISQSNMKPLIDNFVNTQLTSGGVTIDGLTEQSGIYVATITASGQKVPIYFTKDGKFISPGRDLIPINVNGSLNSQLSTSSTNIKLPAIDSNTPLLGDKNAKVTVYEFTDFSCPFCAAASGDLPDMVSYMQKNNPSWQPIVTNLIKDYVNTGKVKLVTYYSMGHSGGHPAQLVAWCLNDQGLYWKFYPQAFAHQADVKDPTKIAYVEDLTKVKALAVSLGADSDKLNSCLDSKKYDSRIDTEENQGVAAGLQGTPYFIVEDSKGKTQSVAGAVSYSQFKSMIDSALSS